MLCVSFYVTGNHIKKSKKEMDKVNFNSIFNFI